MLEDPKFHVLPQKKWHGVERHEKPAKNKDSRRRIKHRFPLDCRVKLAHARGCTGSNSGFPGAIAPKTAMLRAEGCFLQSSCRLLCSAAFSRRARLVAVFAQQRRPLR